MHCPTYKFALREGLTDNQFIPTKAEPNATGWDVRAALRDGETLTIKPMEYFKIPLGFIACPPDGWWFHLHPRSSTFAKKHCHVLIGVIDQDFPNEVLLAGQYIPSPEEVAANQVLTIKFGDAIGQIIPFQLQQMNVEQISFEEMQKNITNKNAARVGGFGSTAK